ncbi:hypothetical protein JXA47_11665, partial [Candidatus Sumerlaeota bacterium]|nr:hypothetical protein [Candidatus Sumerlaeota bacterium]
MPFSRPLIAFALSLLSLSAAAQGDPWTVFSEEAIAHAAADVGSPEIARFAVGDSISGEIWTHPETDEEWLVFDWEGQTAYLSMTHLHCVHPDNVMEGDLPIGEEIVDRWWGLPLDYEPSDLVDIPARFVARDDRTLQLR